VGDEVEAGDTIGISGRCRSVNSGWLDPMLHVEIYTNDPAVAGQHYMGHNPGKVINGVNSGKRADITDPAPYLDRWFQNG
jgi:murein DD-endopeptidase MepM/ murein hydrolase activator NlpD